MMGKELSVDPFSSNKYLTYNVPFISNIINFTFSEFEANTAYC